MTTPGGTMTPRESHTGYNESNSYCPGESVTLESFNDIDGEAQETENVQVVSKNMKKRSKAWVHYIDEFDEITKKKYGRCKHCKIARYEDDSKLGTSNFLRHLTKCSEYKKVAPVESSTTSKPIDLKVLHGLLAKSVMRHALPYQFVEFETIRETHKYLNDNVDTITRNTVKKICAEKHNELKGKIKATLRKLPGRISLTCDTWTSAIGRGYLCLTAHYIDESWTLHSKLLCFRHLKPPHGGYELSVEIGNVLLDWEIEGKIFCLTADNASNMDKMVKLLKDGTTLKDLVCKGKYFHIRCCAHILNLIVKNGLKIIDKSVEKLRESIKYIDGSESRFSKFYALAKRCPNISFSGGLWMDVATRWNSTYVMLSRALKYRSALNLYFEEIGGESGRRYQLSDDEWEKVKKICALLEPFYDITTLFSGSDYPTANLYLPKVYLIRQRLSTPIDDIDTTEDLRDAITEMTGKFNKYWNDYAKVLSLAVVFDPRYKFKYVEYCFCKTYGALEGTRKARELKFDLEEMIKEYQNMVGIENSTISEAFSENLDMLTDFEVDDIDDFEKYDQRNLSKSELDKYLAEDRLSSEETCDVLDHWCKNSAHYPILSSMARDILAIPITSVASESTFSMGGRIISKSRNALKDTNIEVLVTCKNWFTGYDDFNLEGVTVGDVHLSTNKENQ